ncbi:hypothetical protein UA08_06443 [Talaromyces atroroseus]|uniref:Transcription factor domain-containing protein n=1 Tax=Talaromyces atroroseus TaxID=1441469 RepID=A0A225AQM5_TALAT|nr:hypothetical protein UA08_06443 [Talaromyces atroroseus]OKL57909.1 hypothetical protein UA08_06443 [Talaromyces atroroseus]
MKGKNRERVAPRRLAPKSWINRRYDVRVPQIPEQDMLQMGEFMNLHIGSQMNISPSLIGFVPGMEPHMFQLIHKFINTMQKAMYPVENCIDLNEDGRCWYEGFCRDPAFGQTVWHSARAFFNISKSNAMESVTNMEINKAIVMLRQKLAYPGFLITDSTIFTVLALAMISEAFRDYEAAKQHIHGLYQMIKLRGGINALSQKHPLQLKCCRLDLMFALQTASKPLFFAENSLSWEAYLPKHERLPTVTPLDTLDDATDWRLINVWHDLRELITAINLAHQTKRKLSSTLFQEALVSVQYRLQHLTYEICDQHEVLRLALLVFSTTTFFHARLISTCYRDFLRHLDIILHSTDYYLDERSSKLILWFIFVSRLSGIYTPEDYSWMRKQVLQISRSLKLKLILVGLVPVTSLRGSPHS